MKKLFIALSCVFAIVGVSVVATSKAMANNAACSSTSMATVKVPEGNFFNGTSFIMIRSSWLRIVTNGQSKEYDFHAEKDPYGNYVLTFGNGQCITLYSNGRTLNYNGTTYSKK